MIINVTVGTTSERQTFPVNTETATPVSCFEQAGIDYSIGQPMLGAIALRPRELTQTLDELGVKDNIRLTSVVKADSAV